MFPPLTTRCNLVPFSEKWKNNLKLDWCPHKQELGMGPRYERAHDQGGSRLSYPLRRNSGWRRTSSKCFWRTRCSRFGTRAISSSSAMLCLLAFAFIYVFLWYMWMSNCSLAPISFCILCSEYHNSACHKLFPSAGLGAVAATQDALVLANCLYEMKGFHWAISTKHSASSKKSDTLE